MTAPFGHAIRPAARRRSPRGTAAFAAVLATAACLPACGADGRPGRSAEAAGASARPARCAVPRRPAPPAQGGLLVGQHAALRYYFGRVLCDRVALARRSGARMLREDFTWSAIEPQPGSFRWRRWDELVEAAASQGLTLLPVLDGTPRWAGESDTSIPTDPGPFAVFVSRVAARYGPAGAFWRAHRRLPYRPATHIELWNEPYVPQFSAGHPDPATYARLVRAAVARARRFNPRARFLLEGDTSWTTDNENFRDDWMQELYAAVPDLGRYFDGVAVHPYSDDPPDALTAGPHYFRQTRRLEEVRRALLAHGDGAKHIWITEIGWSTCGDAGGCVSEETQADYVRRMFALAHGIWRPYVDALFIYSLMDTGGGDPPKEGFFGLRRPDGSPKPSWFAFRESDGSR